MTYEIIITEDLIVKLAGVKEVYLSDADCYVFEDDEENVIGLFPKDKILGTYRVL